MISLRPAEKNDVPLILSLIRALAEYEREPDAARLTERELLRDGFGPDAWFDCIIAEADGEPAGFALYFPVYSTWEGRSLHLEDIFVKPEFRGRGIGKKLLTSVAAIAAERGCARLQWDVLDWNQPAIEFYQSLGAVMIPEWRKMRVTGDSIQALADSGAKA
ncbi:GNAT family N-acetyltransferase [Acidipila rosea]|uniref:Ribosomal protein S18 acetylase RimI-like enzyme n=1 Tax=Acidipila rosea TaxID=768535 RepID=A0A4R1L3S8_9BACT|nr:GNAT family N-acetyltransferase [Acidipila rosea]TCK72708.1 ribosomal protein S18 acetylase RimI-like enzyme [Acidipila rosea]